MRDLHQGVNARIGPTRALELEPGVAEDPRQGLNELALNRSGILLDLPAAVPAPLVFEKDSETGHGSPRTGPSVWIGQSNEKIITPSSRRSAATSDRCVRSQVIRISTSPPAVSNGARYNRSNSSSALQKCSPILNQPPGVPAAQTVRWLATGVKPQTRRQGAPVGALEKAGRPLPRSSGNRVVQSHASTSRPPADSRRRPGRNR